MAEAEAGGVTDQLDLFRDQPPPEPPNGTEPQPTNTPPRHTTQLAELPGDTWEHIFGDAA